MPTTMPTGLRRSVFGGVAVVVLAAACQSEGTASSSASSGAGLGGGGSGGAALPDPVPLVVANWNVRNFVNDVFDDAVATMEQIDTNWPSRRSDAGAVLAGIDADIVVLQEIEHQDVLDELNELELDGRYQVRAIDGNDPRGIDVGILSKIPFDDVITHKDDSFTQVGTNGPSYSYSRDALEVHVTVNGRRLVLFGVHYRSKNNDDPEKRLAEAQHTRNLANAITAADPEVGVIILGDFNDVPGSAPYDFTIGEPPGEYLNAPATVPASERWTFDFNGALELVDQQMMSPLLAPKLAEVRIVHSFAAEEVSDHAPVVVTYQVN